MRCFIFGTGRCGTVAIAQAFKNAINYTVANESLCSLLEYPDNHIEVNPQLRLRMDELVQKYPDAIFVWLKRNTKAVEKSYANLDNKMWIEAWWSFNNKIRPTENTAAAVIAVRNIEKMCEDAWKTIKNKKCRSIKMDIDFIKNDFINLWNTLGCEGDLKSAINSLKVPVNTTAERNKY
ncbi:MAG TPA: hypothetical protein DDX98_13795 [Bacteroidales bacterium]|nr:hypothetical protein [Bacteroidales bacterium]